MLEKHTYCVKCQQGKTIIGQFPVVMKNGATALKGRCPSCESVAYKIVSKDALQNIEANKKEEAFKKEEIFKKEPESQSHLGLALATFALGLAIGATIAVFL